jgi:hypothetical protein
MNCVICGNETSYRTAKTCSEMCKHKLLAFRHNDKKKQELSEEEFRELAECKICGIKGSDLTSHITRRHGISVDEYRNRYNVERIHSLGYLKKSSMRITGDKNPVHKLKDKQEISPFSYKFYLKRGFSESVSREMALAKSRKMNNDLSPNQDTSKIEYWIKKCGGDIVCATEMYIDRQTTFSKKICVEKYGEEEGVKIWQARQDRWMSTMNSKTDGEKAEINKKKLKSIIGCAARSYSKISQELFKRIYYAIEHKYKDVYFATLKDNGDIIDDGINNEYKQLTELSYKLLDFYIPSINKCIEFDGEYFHSDEFRGGTIARDAKREKDILEAAPEMKILHITEREFKENRKETIDKCLRFING